MKNSMVLLLALFISTSSFAAKSYQVTGPVLAITADTITVQKGKETWELARDATTKVSEVKVGDKVTIMYTMTATKISKK